LVADKVTFKIFKWRIGQFLAVIAPNYKRHPNVTAIYPNLIWVRLGATPSLSPRSCRGERDIW
jgi:hypothetical protein